MSSSFRSSDEWGNDPTVNESQHDTAPHDLSGLARALASPADHEGVLRAAFGEGVEEAVRALYVVMRRKGLTRAEMDAIVLAVRGEIVSL